MSDHPSHPRSSPHLSPEPTGPRPPRRGYALWLIAGITVAVLLAANLWVWSLRQAYAAETDRLRESMTAVERRRADEILAGERHTFRLALELLRRQARLEPSLHLSVTVDSSRMYLERDGALLRVMPVQVGPERRVGEVPDTVRVAAPRGVRTIVRVLGEGDAWEVPAWLYQERGVPAEPTRVVIGALGPVAVLLEGGAVLYSLPSVGPLNDSSYVLPGAVRVRADDLRAILPNLTVGMRVYFY